MKALYISKYSHIWGKLDLLLGMRFLALYPVNSLFFLGLLGYLTIQEGFLESIGLA